MRSGAWAWTWALVILLAVTGCSEDGATAPVPTDPGTTGAGTATATGDELVITVRDASGTSSRWRLTCDPPGGDHPDPETACRVLAEHGATALPPVPKDRRCSQVYGGPETATITGRWQGRPVLSRLSRVDGCETSRWNALVGLLPRPGA